MSCGLARLHQDVCVCPAGAQQHSWLQVLTVKDQAAGSADMPLALQSSLPYHA